MRFLLLIVTFHFVYCFKATSQYNDTLPAPKVKVLISLLKDTFKVGDDIQLTMTLINETKQTQSVWFNKPLLRTGGPAWTCVMLTNKATGKSVLKYQNKEILQSTLYSTEQVKSFFYPLEPGKSIKGQFDLYDMVATNTENHKVNKRTYKMQVFYNMTLSNIINFIVE